MLADNEAKMRSLRILVDLQACQTEGSARRGVGRYSQALFSAICDARGAREIHALVNKEFGEQPDCSPLPGGRRHHISQFPDWHSERDHWGGDLDALDSLALSAHVADIEPDLVHISHVFEGYSERVPLPSYSNRPAGQVLSATLYDLIPLRFPEFYFQDVNFERWYLQRLRWLRNADLLLAISESTRSDAISLLDIDPSRVVTIHGGVSGRFKPRRDDDLRKSLCARYGLYRPNIVLYTGGDDHRKNLTCAIEAFSSLPSDVRSASQLVIVCQIAADRKAMYLNLAQRKGLQHDEVVFTGYISDDDLLGFYNICSLFVFPSLYEGFGLPVLEAMACGAPVIGADNSSIRELIADDAATFDARDPHAFAVKMSEVLTNRSLARHLREKGIARASQFSWRRSADLALEAMDQALARKRTEGEEAASSGWLKRRRLAILTPLPPSRSGIADYNASFLHYLAQHFEIDLFVDDKVSSPGLNACFRIFDVRDFDAVATQYDAILYEFGNSEFHAHMVSLLERHPGIVGLHDAYLSGLMGYFQFNLAEPNRYFKEMLDAHAGLARRYFAPVAAHPNGIGEAMIELPCMARILRFAKGIISHSSFNLDVARMYHPEGWRAAWRIVPQMAPSPKHPAVSRVEERAMHGIAPNDFVVTTFGHVAWTKWGDRLLDAFVSSGLVRDNQCRLIFAGALADDDFGRRLQTEISRLKCANSVTITGYLDDDEYARYLRISDLAVQLRTKSRGGTPKGVLDCLSYRLPVIVNEDASYRDYPAGVVIKVSAEPAPSELAGCLLEMRENVARRLEVAQRGYDYVREYHDPKRCAAQYASAISEFIDRSAARTSTHIVEAMAPHLISSSNRCAAADNAAQIIDARPSPNFARPRLVIDVSHAANSNAMTGITRVVSETVKATYLSARPGFQSIAVTLENGELIEAKPFLNRQRLLLPYEVEEPAARIQFAAGDHLLMLDSSWPRFGEFAPAFSCARSSGASITTAIYDLLPITLPNGDVVAGGREWFEGWLRAAIAASDSLVCISGAVANELTSFIEREGLARSGLKIGWWHLGAGLSAPAASSTGGVAQTIASPFMVMVGTIAPHKNQQLALDAFEQLWAKNVDLSLVIAGKPGWLVEELVDRLKGHPQLGRKLHFLDSPADTDVAALYQKAAGLLMISKAEGFGLPLVEAASFGTPLVLSDIPVFREIAGGHATYVDATSAQALAEGIAVWNTRFAAGSVAKSSEMPRLNWEESTSKLLEMLLDQRWQMSF